MLKPLTMWITTNCGKLLERWEYQTILPVFWETWMWVKKQQLEPCMEQLIGSRSRKEYDRAVCCHPVCLTYTLITWEMPGWEKYQQPQICGWYHSKLKLQYFGHLMQRADSLEKTLMLGRIGGRRRRGRQRMRWLDGITDLMDVESEWTPGVGDGQGGLACCNSWGCKESDTNEWLNWNEWFSGFPYFLQFKS